MRNMDLEGAVVQALCLGLQGQFLKSLDLHLEVNKNPRVRMTIYSGRSFESDSEVTMEHDEHGWKFVE